MKVNNFRWTQASKMLPSAQKTSLPYQELIQAFFTKVESVKSL